MVKGSVDPFVGTPLLNMLVGRGIRRLAIGGVATKLAVESAVRHAADLVLAVTVIEDLCASFSSEAHDFSTRVILPLFARVVSSDELLSSP